MGQLDLVRLAGVIGRPIGKQRVESGLVQEQVAESIGVGKEEVLRMERGIVMPTVACLVEVAEIFGCDAADALTEASTRTSDQAKYAGQLLTKLSSTDRAIVVEIVEPLAGRLARRCVRLLLRPLASVSAGGCELVILTRCIGPSPVVRCQPSSAGV